MNEQQAAVEQVHCGRARRYCREKQIQLQECKEGLSASPTLFCVDEERQFALGAREFEAGHHSADLKTPQ